MHKACAPRRMYVCLETYEFRPANPDADMRGPSGKEFRQVATQAIGCGAKGITSWFWSSGSGMYGVKHLPDMYAEYVRMNKLIEHIEGELLLGTPIDIVTNDAGLTRAGSWVFYEDGPYKLEAP